jgi:apolipoprotein N-acyltransferase
MRAAVIAGLLHGVCVFAAWPPVNAWPLTFAAAAVTMWVGARATGRPARLALGFAIGTLPLWFSQQAWLVNVTPVGYPLLAFYMAFWSGLCVWAIARARRTWPRVPMVVAGPLAWLAVEVLRGEVVLTGYGWFHLAHPLIARPELAAPAGVLGTYFVSFLAAALVGAMLDVAAAWMQRPRREREVLVRSAALGAVVAAWAVTAVFGSGGPAPRRTVHIGVVQTNVPQGQKLQWSADRVRTDFARFIELTRALAQATPRPEVIIWPETMFPGVSLNDEAVATFEAVFRANDPTASPDDLTLNGAMNQAIRRLQREIGIPLLIGSNEAEGTRVERVPNGRAEFEYAARYNSVVLIHDGRVDPPPNRYDKLDLTPFGEVIPYVWRWPGLQRAVLSLGAAGMKFDLSPGVRAGPLRVPLGGDAQPPRELLVATPICFEATRSGLCRRLAVGEGGRSADVIVNLSNDGWFGDIRFSPVNSDAGRAQHLLAARWRCVELGLPMVRAVNTGISGAVDADGRIAPVRIVAGLERPIGTDGALIASVQLPETGSIFMRLGNVFAWAAMAAGWAMILLACIRGRGLTNPVEAAAR